MDRQRSPVSVPCSPSCQTFSPPPFSIALLRNDDSSSDMPPPSDDQLLSLLPASYRTKSDDLVAASRQVAACVEKELDLRRLNKVFSWLWVAGRPMPPRPLHHQVLLSREIFVTERMDMHLVWTTGRMFLKPIPRFLLEPRFWSLYLSCAHHCRCPKEDVGSGECGRKLWKCALGFLFSYAALMTHESDFLMAKEKHLVPADATWPAWRTLVEQLDTEHIYPDVDRRFVYGELRLSRLDKIYYLSQTPLRKYMSHWHQYGAFFQDNLAWLASAVVYITVVLTAMQVGLATNALAGNGAFQSASYGFTAFSILGPLVTFGLVMVAFCYIFVNSWVVAVIYKNTRFRHIQEQGED